MGNCTTKPKVLEDRFKAPKPKKKEDETVAATIVTKNEDDVEVFDVVTKEDNKKEDDDKVFEAVARDDNKVVDREIVVGDGGEVNDVGDGYKANDDHSNQKPSLSNLFKENESKESAEGDKAPEVVKQESAMTEKPSEPANVEKSADENPTEELSEAEMTMEPAVLEKSLTDHTIEQYSEKPTEEPSVVRKPAEVAAAAQSTPEQTAKAVKDLQVVSEKSAEPPSLESEEPKKQEPPVVEKTVEVDEPKFVEIENSETSAKQSVTLAPPVLLDEKAAEKKPEEDK